MIQDSGLTSKGSRVQGVRYPPSKRKRPRIQGFCVMGLRFQVLGWIKLLVVQD